MAWRRTCSVLLAAGLALSATGGSGPASADEKPTVEPRAAQILTAALTKLAGAQSFTFRAEVTNETPLAVGPKLQYAGTLEVAVRRPDRLWYKLDGEQRNATAWYDGKVFSLLDASKKACARWQVQEKLDALFPAMKEKLGFTPPLSPLLGEQVRDEALKRVTSGFYVGQGVVRGVPAHHLAFRQENIDWQIWIAAEGEPLIKRIVITSRLDPAATQSTTTFLDWDFAPQLADAVFAYTPAEGVIQCEFERPAK